MDAPDLEVILARVRDLEARLEAKEHPDPPMQLRPARYVPEPPVTRALAEVASSGPLRPLTIREARQLAVAVALSRGALALPGAEVFADYAEGMVRLAEARVEGLSWRAALERCDMEVPDEAEVREQARSLRGELRWLWDGVLPVLVALERRLPNWQYKEFIDTFRVLLV